MALNERIEEGLGKESAKFEQKDSKLKQYILVRKDLKVSVGKIIVHACHASQIATFDAYFLMHDQFSDWINNDMTKIVLGVKNENHLFKFWEKIYEKEQVPIGLLADVGYYEVPEGTKICMAIGPIDDATAKRLGLKRLRLYGTKKHKKIFSRLLAFFRKRS